MPLALSASLNRCDTQELFRRWRDRHDESARDRLVALFLPLAERLARRYRGTREPTDDLVQVASLGLINAIDRYDPDRGVAFPSFAAPTILGELKRYFRDYGWAVRVPRGIQERAVKVEHATRRLTAATGRPPTIGELGEYLELGVEEVLDALEAAASHHAISLETPRDAEGEAGTLGDAIGAVDERFEFIDTRVSVGGAAAKLTDRERHVVALRFIHDCSQTQIAREIGVSQMQVSRIIRRSLAKMQATIEHSCTC